jgi:hypothetical protein
MTSRLQTVFSIMHLSGLEAVSFLGVLKYAYLFGAVLSVLAAFLSLLQTRAKAPK